LRARVTGSTAGKYLAATWRFLTWVGSHRTTLWGGLDRVLNSYLHHLFRSGKGKGEAAAVFYGLNLLLPEVSRGLPVARAALSGFHRQLPSESWPPLPWRVTVLLSAWMAARGHRRAAVGTVLAFHCYLRAATELLPLVREDVALGDDPRLGTDDGRVFLRLRNTKTGANKGVEVLDPCIRLLVAELVRTTPVGARLFRLSPSEYRVLFRDACQALGLTGYVPHSLRHGGATFDYLKGVPVQDICVRGRWAVTKSALTYIQTGRQLLLAKAVPPVTAGLASTCQRFPLSRLLGGPSLQQDGQSGGHLASVGGRPTSGARPVVSVVLRPAPGAAGPRVAPVILPSISAPLTASAAKAHAGRRLNVPLASREALAARRAYLKRG
jgi:integrase